MGCRAVGCDATAHPPPPSPCDIQTVKHEVMGAYTLIVTRTKGAVDDAAARLTTVLERDPDCVPALLALATAAMVQVRV